MSILEALYREWYMVKSGIHPDTGAAQKQFGELWDKAEKQLGRDFSEELRSSIFDYMDAECGQDFQAGFRLGVLLMQELHTPAPWSDHNPSRA